MNVIAGQSNCQHRALISIASTWKEIGPGDYGEHDVMDHVSKSKGWCRLLLNEKIEVGFGNGKRYRIERIE
jgi:hypothetical protein